MYNILFLGCFYPKELCPDISRRSKRGFQYAANNLQNSFINGLCDNLEKFEVLTKPAISTFPFGYNEIYFKGCEIFEMQYHGQCVNFLNLPILNSAKNQLSKHIEHWYTKTNGKKVVIIYALLCDLLVAATEIKNQYPDLKICQIIPDLPQHISGNLIYRILGLRYRDIRTIERLIGYVDCFVLLSENMRNKLHMHHKPYIRLEGIYNNEIEQYHIEKNDEKILLYSGTLSEKYGLKNLLQAFSLISNPEYKLWICGDGPMKNLLLRQSKVDPRIMYWGVLSFDETKILQRKATVLINPRTSKGTYTEYSFPSKTLEYLASGTPTILYKLGGIPNEYYDYAFIPTDESVENLKKKILELCEMDPVLLITIGKNARDFILKNKNPKTQVFKVLEMINRL